MASGTGNIGLSMRVFGADMLRTGVGLLPDNALPGYVAHSTISGPMIIDLAGTSSAAEICRRNYEAEWENAKKANINVVLGPRFIRSATDISPSYSINGIFHLPEGRAQKRIIKALRQLTAALPRDGFMPREESALAISGVTIKKIIPINFSSRSLFTSRTLADHIANLCEGEPAPAFTIAGINVSRNGNVYAKCYPHSDNFFNIMINSRKNFQSIRPVDSFMLPLGIIYRPLSFSEYEKMISTVERYFNQLYFGDVETRTLSFIHFNGMAALGQGGILIRGVDFIQHPKGLPSTGIESLDLITDKRELYGMKAINLSRMMDLGLPVPPGFVITSEDLEKDEIPIDALRAEIHKLEKMTGKILGSRQAPLRLSVRSSPSYSMPGLLRTDIDISSEDELIRAINNVKASLQREEVKRFVEVNGLDDRPKTAVIVQIMVEGDMSENSASGVLFTRDPLNGEDKLSGRFAMMTTGSSVVSRSGMNTFSIDASLADEFPTAFKELKIIKGILEKELKQVQEVEFVIEDGRLWILQTRDAVMTPRAQVNTALAFERQGVIDQFRLLSLLESAGKRQIMKLRPSVEYGIDRMFGTGNTSSPGAASGPIAFSLEKAREYARSGRKAILFAVERPSEISQAILSGEIAGIITEYGHEALHESVLARYEGVPMMDGRLFGMTRDEYRYEVRPRIEGSTLIYGKSKLEEGTEIVMEVNDKSGYFWLKGGEPVLVPDRLITIKGMDFDYKAEEKAVRRKYRAIDYLELVELHANLIRILHGSTEITNDSIRQNLTAHVMHQLLIEKGKEAGRTLAEVENDISGGAKASSPYVRNISRDDPLFKKFGIAQIIVTDFDITLDFLNMSVTVGDPKVTQALPSAKSARELFIKKLLEKGAVNKDSINEYYDVWDPMPHGHASSWQDHELGIKLRLGYESREANMKFLNDLLSLFGAAPDGK